MQDETILVPCLSSSQGLKIVCLQFHVKGDLLSLYAKGKNHLGVSWAGKVCMQWQT